jgi:hypothetical protein
MSKRPLPLDSPNWTPFDELHPLVCAQTGDRGLADRDLTDALANDGVRSMRRRVSPQADKPERELLPPSFWADYELNSDAGAADEQRLLVVKRARGPLPTWLGQGAPPGLNRTMLGLRGVPLPGYVFFAWKPDWRKIWGVDAASTEARPPAQEVRVERGRKKVYEHAALTAIAFALFEHRKQGEPEKSQAEVARELRDWCKEQKEKVPGNTTLNEIVSVAFHARKKWKASLKR